MFILDIDGRRVKVIVDGDERMKHVFFAGDVYQFTRVEPGAAQAPKEVSGDLTAPLTGRVVKVLVAEGDEVDERTQIMIIEAMKMEHKVRAPFKGRVGRLSVSEGEMVEGGQSVARIVRPDGDEAEG
ncbi:MAG: HlyD family efflux transporter periplasmic adaptor subunit [Thermoplasmata archaeon]|nr:HlyD family efflux transporter periplasmic adaptor subunit [Thermoplasmata archaeon]